MMTVLIKSGKAVTVRLHREMSSIEVSAKLKKVLKPHITAADYTILDCCGVKFMPCSKEQPSGATLIESALNRRGNTLYVTKKIVEISESSDVSS